MGKSIYTVGYGGRKPDELIALLKENEISFIIDVRLLGARAYIHPYWSGGPIKAFLIDHGIEYKHSSVFGNRYDNFDDYQEWLSTPEGIGGLRYEAEWIQKGYDYFHKDTPDVRYCLLCCEKRAYARGGLGLPSDAFVVQCHRVYVANALVNLLGEDWEVEHL